MCGIVGLVGPLVLDPGEIKPALDAAVRSLRTRGPDGNGTYMQPGIALGHTRLSIIDVSDSAAQPMFTHDRRYAIVFNGEIYNFKHLYLRFLSEHPTVNRNSDTSVLLHLFAKLGRDCLHLLEGMFSFAIYDFQQRRLFAARDRFGEKPFHWTKSRLGFAFASEISAMRAMLPKEKWEIDTSSLRMYEIYGSVPAPRTVFESVHSLEAGCFLDLDATGNVTTHRYWDLVATANDLIGESRSQSEIVEEVQTLLLESVSACLVSDVPVGLFLSGGYDSSALMGLCEALGANDREAVCIDFDEEPFSEFQYAAAAAKHYRGTLKRQVIRESDFYASIGDFFATMDQPTVDGYNTYFVCRAAKEVGIKVWLSGVGGDEMFGGYPSFRRMHRWKQASAAGQVLLPGVALALTSTVFPTSLRIARIANLGEPGPPRLRAYQACRNTIPWRNAVAIGSAESRPSSMAVFPALLDQGYPEIPNGLDDFQAASLFETEAYMRNLLLRDIDDFSMCHSLELRAPFLNHRLFALVLALPASFKVKAGRVKPLLVDALPMPLPDVIVNRGKQGFGFPMEKWALSGMAKDFRGVVLDKSNSVFWDLTKLEKLWTEFVNNRVHWSVLWRYYAFARWRDAA